MVEVIKKDGQMVIMTFSPVMQDCCSLIQVELIRCHSPPGHALSRTEHRVV